MLCPNTQAVTNGYSTGWGPRPFSPKRAEIWIWGLKNVYETRRPNPIFPKIPRKLDVWMGKIGKKVYEKRGKQVFTICFNKLTVYYQGFLHIIINKIFRV